MTHPDWVTRGFSTGPLSDNFSHLDPSLLRLLVASPSILIIILLLLHHLVPDPRETQPNLLAQILLRVRIQTPPNLLRLSQLLLQPEMPKLQLIKSLLDHRKVVQVAQLETSLLPLRHQKATTRLLPHQVLRALLPLRLVDLDPEEWEV